ncbi:MAG: GNAT family N-acetyltransferase [Pseudomonadota bacterium]
MGDSAPGGRRPDAASLPAEYTVTWLEMTARPRVPVPAAPSGMALALLTAENPPTHWFLYLYRKVGEAYLWDDWIAASEAERAAFVGDPEVTLHTLFVDGAPGGFFMLDTREKARCDLAYFGLMPEAVGRGLGHWFLMTAVDAAWQRPGVERMTVNTCTLDHPRALGNYQKAGFVPVRRETRPLR